MFCPGSTLVAFTLALSSSPPIEAMTPERVEIVVCVIVVVALVDTKDVVVVVSVLVCWLEVPTIYPAVALAITRTITTAETISFLIHRIVSSVPYTPTHENGREIRALGIGIPARTKLTDD